MCVRHKEGEIEETGVSVARGREMKQSLMVLPHDTFALAAVVIAV